MIGKLLGHTQVQAAPRYAHLANEPVKIAADQVAAKLSTALLQQQSVLRAIMAFGRHRCASYGKFLELGESAFDNVGTRNAEDMLDEGE